MSVIIRLQNLPWSANALDIRTYFRGLSIPEGGVHIVGGEMGDAFIAFSTDEDARQAMMSDGGKIKDVQVKLLLSSRAEMQKIIEAARQQALAFMAIPPQPPIISTLTGLLPHSMLANQQVDASRTTPAAESDNPVKDTTSKTDDNRDSDKSSRDDKKRDRDRSSRSRSRDRRRDRSRSRERRDRRRRDRSRSRDRRNRRRDTGRRDRSRDKSRERTRDRDSNSRRPRDGKRDAGSEKSKSNSSSPTANKKPVNVWENPTGNNAVPAGGLNGANNAALSTGIATPLLTQNVLNHNAFKPWTVPPPVGFNAEQLTRLQNLEGRRNPSAFQGNNAPNDTYTGSCVQVLNLDSTTSYSEIRNFFPKLYIPHNGIKMINDRRTGRRTGISYVRFGRQDCKAQALACSGQQIRGHTVEVRHLDDKLFDEADDAYRPPIISSNHILEIDSDTEGELQIVDDPGSSSNTNTNSRSNNKESENNFTVLKLDSLPSFAKEHHVMKMFSDYSIMNIHLIEGAGTMGPKDSRKTHLAYVEFHRAADALCALNDENRHVLGHKKVDITSCTMREFREAKEGTSGLDEVKSPSTDSQNEDKNSSPLKDPRQRRVDNNDMNAKFLLTGNVANYGMNTAVPDHRMRQFDNHSSYMVPPLMQQTNGLDLIETDWVVLNNLPFKVSDRDIMDFFSDIGLVPSRLHLLPSRDGNNYGAEANARCFCRFEGGPDDVRRACTKDGMPLGMTRISVAPVHQSVVEDATGIREAPPSILKQQQIHQQQPQPQQLPQTQLPPPSMSQLPPPMMNNNAGQALLGHAPPGLMGVSTRQIRPPMGFRGARGGASAPFGARGSFRGRGGGNFNHRPLPGGAMPPHGMIGQGPPGPGADSGLDGFGAPGCVVSLENVPFRAGIEEILEFFREFDVPRENVIRRFNETGHPTGDAKVAFMSPQDAKRAVDTRMARGPNCKIRDRRIYMTIT